MRQRVGGVRREERCNESDSEAVDDITLGEVEANGLVFRYRLCGKACQRGDVLLLHGFPEWSSDWEPLMRELAEEGFRSVAFDQRGYSPGAAPDSPAAYHYDQLRSDIFAVADACGFGRFHLVGHDHGALLGWYAAGSEVGGRRLCSYTALSIPHPDAFSEGLLGESADFEQQVATQYFTMFVMPGSASRACGLLYNMLGRTTGFKSRGQFQKALWWYNGAFDAGVLSMPPLMSASTLCCRACFPLMAFLRCVFGGTPDTGTRQTRPTGEITVPVLYAIGELDRVILGGKPFALKTANYCKGGYRFLQARCGHGMVNVDAGCGSRQLEARRGVMAAIVSHISANSSSSSSA